MQTYKKISIEEYEELTNKILQLQKELEEEKYLHQLDEKTEDMYRNLYLEERQKFYNLKVWLEKKRDYCIQEKDKKYIDDLGKEQLLGCYLTCIEVLERLVGDGINVKD